MPYDDLLPIPDRNGSPHSLLWLNVSRLVLQHRPQRFAARTLSLALALFLAAIGGRVDTAFAVSRAGSTKVSALGAGTTQKSAKTRPQSESQVKSQVKSQASSLPAARTVQPKAQPRARGVLPAIVSPRIQVKSSRYGGRVQRDAFGRWIIDGTILGLASVNVPAGQDAVFDTTLPAGLSPLELRGHYVVPSTSASSWLEIGVSGSIPQRVKSAGDRSFVAITQLGAAVQGTSYVEFTARSKITGSCPTFQAAQIDKVQLLAVGNPDQPETLAEFFPPFLDRLIVVVDPASKSKASKAIDESVAQAVLRLTTFAVQRWPEAHVVVSDHPIAMTPYDRQISIRQARDGIIALEKSARNTTLILAGPQARYPALADFLGSPELQTTFVSTLRTFEQTEQVSDLVHVLTIGDLRGKALVSKGFGSVEQVVTVTQSQLGGQTESIAVRVSGVAQVAGTERLIVQLRANDQVLASKRVSNDEPFTLKGKISRSTLARDNVIVVRASEVAAGSSRVVNTTSSDANGNQIVCAAGRPEVTLQLDPGSQFAATMGRGLPAGFDRFPQAFSGGFDVRFASLGFGELQAAVDVVQLLQNLSAPRLSPKVFGPNRNHKPTRPMVYIGPPTSELAKLDAPIVPPTKLGKHAEPISVLQGFAATGDDHLVLVTNGPPSDLASTLASVRADPRGWRSLRGDVVVHQNGRVRNVRVRASSGSGEEKRRVVLHSRIGYALRFGFLLGTAVALFGALLSRLFGRRNS